MKPILFNTEMVRAILDGRKTQTRRPFKKATKRKKWTSRSKRNWMFSSLLARWITTSATVGCFKAPQYEVNDILYVRETWQQLDMDYKSISGKIDITEWEGCPIVYKATDVPSGNDFKWRPSIHMPKEAARIFLKVTDVRIERLLDIDEWSAYCEGFETGFCDGIGETTSREEFFDAWDNIYTKYSCDNNPWVIVYEFERCEKPEGERT